MNGLTRRLSPGSVEAMAEAKGKFAGYEGQRLLLIDISQTELDWDFHVMPSLTWVQSAPPSNVDENQDRNLTIQRFF